MKFCLVVGKKSFVGWSGCGVCGLFIFLGGWFWWWRGFCAGFSLFVWKGLLGFASVLLGCLVFSSTRFLAMRRTFLVVFGGKWTSSKILVREGCFAGGKLAPEAGLEPATRWLTASCSTIELLWKLKIGKNFNRDRGRCQDCFVDFLAWLAVRAEKGASRSLNDSLNFFRTANAVFSFSNTRAPVLRRVLLLLFVQSRRGHRSLFERRKGLAARSRRAQWLGTR